MEIPSTATTSVTQRYLETSTVHSATENVTTPAPPLISSPAIEAVVNHTQLYVYLYDLLPFTEYSIEVSV